MADQTYDRTTIELQRLIAETNKFVAEQRKLLAEAGKLRLDRWLGPVIVIFGGLGSLIAGYSAVAALLHVAGLPHG